MMTIFTVITVGIYFKTKLMIMNEMYAALIFWGLCSILIWATTPTPI
jgi:hypothetical protein